jgi:hypothetical protein
MNKMVARACMGASLWHADVQPLLASVHIYWQVDKISTTLSSISGIIGSSSNSRYVRLKHIPKSRISRSRQLDDSM